MSLNGFDKPIVAKAAVWVSTIQVQAPDDIVLVNDEPWVSRALRLVPPSVVE